MHNIKIIKAFTKSNKNGRSIRLFSASTSTSIAYPVHQSHPNFITPQTHLLKPSIFIDPKLYISTLINCKKVLQIQQVHSQIVVTGCHKKLPVANKLLHVYCQCRDVRGAFALFGEMRERDAVSWSVMIGGLARVCDYVKCFGLFREFIRAGVRPNNYTLPCVIRTCRDTFDVQMGRVAHQVVIKCGLDFDHSVGATLVDMYGKCRVIDDARKMFDIMVRRDLVTWTVMIGGYADCGNAKESLVLFDRMSEEGVVPDKIAIVTIVHACAKVGAMHKARLIHDYIEMKKFSLDVILGTAVIDMYAKCGSIDSAKAIFDEMKEKNVISWSAMIGAYGYHGLGKEALELFSMMLRSGSFPNRITFVSLLYACSHTGLVEEGRRIFSLMWEHYTIRPDVKHYTCMVDLLGRAGKLDEALDLIENMTVEKDESLWGALLAACRIHKHIELAEKAAKSLMELQPQNAGNYVLLSNIYANAGKWDDVAKIRGLMGKRRLKKVPGWTWIEVDNNIHQFSVGGMTHPRSQEILLMLRTLSKKLDLVGYVPDTNFVLHDVDEELKIDMLYSHSEKLAIAFGLIGTPEGTPIRITKNLRVCGDCHTFCKFVSDITQRVIIVRDSNRFHRFKQGVCSCGDYW